MVVWLNLWKVSSRHSLIMPPKKNEEKFTEMLDEALQPIKEAMENLITKEMMTKLISGIEDKLVKKMIEQGREIDKLKLSNSQLEGRVAILEHLVKVQEAKYDDIEQYGRRLCLRVNDVPLTKDETSKEVEDKLKEEFINMGLNLPKNAIDRAHRIGRKYQVQAQQESDDGNEAGVTTKQQVIIRFTSWRFRTEVYKKRKNSKKFKFKMDLTKRRFMLLKNAIQATKDIEGVDYIFCDINCRLNIKFVDGRVRAFNSESEMASLISASDESGSETSEVRS